MPAPAIVHEFLKNRREVVRTTLQDYHGRRVVDLRVWLPRSSDGVLVPAAKGLTVDRSQLDALEEALRAARHALDTQEFDIVTAADGGTGMAVRRARGSVLKRAPALGPNRASARRAAPKARGSGLWGEGGRRLIDRAVSRPTGRSSRSTQST